MHKVGGEGMENSGELVVSKGEVEFDGIMPCEIYAQRRDLRRVVALYHTVILLDIFISPLFCFEYIMH
jgi:hypothetical protein